VGAERELMKVLVAPDAEARASAARLAARADASTGFGSAVRELLDDLADGGRFILLRPHHEVTPAGAAELLGVTRQYVDRLLADGALPYRRLPGSTHRRIEVRHVLALAEERGRHRRGAAVLSATLRASGNPE
jgi:excisionase family DNA binding protein